MSQNEHTEQFGDFDRDVRPQVVAALTATMPQAHEEVEKDRTDDNMTSIHEWREDRASVEAKIADLKRLSEQIGEDVERISASITVQPAAPAKPSIEHTMQIFKDCFEKEPALRERVLAYVKPILVPEYNAAQVELSEVRQRLQAIEESINAISQTQNDLSVQLEESVEAALPASKNISIQDMRMISVGREYCRVLGIDPSLLTAEISRDMAAIADALASFPNPFPSHFPHEQLWRWIDWAPQIMYKADKGFQSATEFLLAVHQDAESISYCGVRRNLEDKIKNSNKEIPGELSIYQVAISRLLTLGKSSDELQFIVLRILELLAHVLPDLSHLSPMLNQAMAFCSSDEDIVLSGFKEYISLLYKEKTQLSPAYFIHNAAKRMDAVVPSPRGSHRILLMHGDNLLILSSPDTASEVQRLTLDEYHVGMDEDGRFYLCAPEWQLKHEIQRHQEDWYMRHVNKACVRYFGSVRLPPARPLGI